jgi:glucoamylase
MRSRHDGVGFDLLPPVRERYCRQKVQSQIETWSFAHQVPRIRAGKRLRILLEAPATVHWSIDAWASAQAQEAQPTAVACWFADLPAAQWNPGTRLEFTFHWKDRWEGRNFTLELQP